MSARVFNPSAAMELRRALRAGQGEATAAAALVGFSAAEAARAPAPALERVRRNLFGPIDHEESRKFVDRELAAQRARDEDFYEFDFNRGVPRAGQPHRFAWQVVSAGPVHESYALRRFAFLSVATAEQQQEQQQAQQAQQTSAEAAVAAAAAAIAAAAAPCGSASPGPSCRPPCTPAPARTRQTRINDFMRTRKRPGPCTDSTSAKAAKAAASTASCDADDSLCSSSSSSGGGGAAKLRKSAAAPV